MYATHHLVLIYISTITKIFQRVFKLQSGQEVEKCLRLDRLFRGLKQYVCLYPLSYIVTPTAKTKPQKLHILKQKNPRKSTTRGHNQFLCLF